MKKIYLLIALAMLGFGILQASPQTIFLTAATGEPNQSISIRIQPAAYGYYMVAADCQQRGAFSEAIVHFADGSYLHGYSNCSSGQGNGWPKWKYGSAVSARVTAITGEHGYYHPDAQSRAVLQYSAIH